MKIGGFTFSAVVVGLALNFEGIFSSGKWADLCAEIVDAVAASDNARVHLDGTGDDAEDLSVKKGFDQGFLFASKAYIFVHYVERAGGFGDDDLVFGVVGVGRLFAGIGLGLVGEASALLEGCGLHAVVRPASGEMREHQGGKQQRQDGVGFHERLLLGPKDRGLCCVDTVLASETLVSRCAGVLGCCCGVFLQKMGQHSDCLFFFYNQVVVKMSFK